MEQTKISYNKGKSNVNWKGGIAEYPNHYFMKKQRLIILMNNPKCERCSKPATEIHHRNGNKADHRLVNLMASCRSCNSKIRFKPSDCKYRRLYGKSLKELGKQYNITSICYRIKNNIPLDSPRPSKYRKLYGKTLRELAKESNTSIFSIWEKLKAKKAEV